jgi:hypothetical protein
MAEAYTRLDAEGEQLAGVAVAEEGREAGDLNMADSNSVAVAEVEVHVAHWEIVVQGGLRDNAAGLESTA